MITEMNARFLTRARKRRKNLGNFFVAGTKFILMANVGGYAGLRIRNSGVETTGGTVCEPSKLYRSHAPRPRKRGRGRKSSDPTAPRRTPLSMLSRPFCFPTSSRSCLSIPDNSYARRGHDSSPEFSYPPSTDVCLYQSFLFRPRFRPSFTEYKN